MLEAAVAGFVLLARGIVLSVVEAFYMLLSELHQHLKFALMIPQILLLLIVLKSLLLVRDMMHALCTRSAAYLFHTRFTPALCAG